MYGIDYLSAKFKWFFEFKVKAVSFHIIAMFVHNKWKECASWIIIYFSKKYIEEKNQEYFICVKKTNDVMSLGDRKTVPSEERFRKQSENLLLFVGFWF